MSRKFVSCVLVVSLLVYAGCSSSYVVSSPSSTGHSFNAFNIDAYGRSATIVFRDGREVDVRSVVASSDSIHFMGGETGATDVVPTSGVQKVILTDRTAGLLEGFGIGALIGGVTMLTLAAVSPGGGHELSGFEAVFMLLGAAGGGVIGGVWGVISGHSNEYQFVTSGSSTTTQ